MIPVPFYITFLVLAGLLLLVFAYSLFNSSSAKKKPAPANPLPKDKAGESGVCPICGTILSRGEQIKSAVFPGKTDRICHIFGCPHCHPYKDASVKRICPVCKKMVPQEGYLIARLFERANNKRHVHILGCTVCRIPQKH
jgi:hypothetical protein